MNHVNNNFVVISTLSWYCKGCIKEYTLIIVTDMQTLLESVGSAFDGKIQADNPARL